MTPGSGWRERQVHHLIQRKVSEARSLRDLIEALKSSRALRRSVYARKLEAFLGGAETIDNLIQTRTLLFDTEKDLVEGLAGFFEIVIELDVASGFYFKHLDHLINSIEGAYGFDKRRSESSTSNP